MMCNFCSTCLALLTHSIFHHHILIIFLSLFFQGSYPAKLKKVLIVTAPLWFKAPFKILRLFVREKLRDRVFTVSVSNLSLHIPKTSLPTRLGGTLVVNHLVSIVSMLMFPLFSSH